MNFEFEIFLNNVLNFSIHRASNLGVLPNDKYGLQTAYIARKKAMNSRKQESMQAPHQLFASNDVPGIPFLNLN